MYIVHVIVIILDFTDKGFGRSVCMSFTGHGKPRKFRYRHFPLLVSSRYKKK